MKKIYTRYGFLILGLVSTIWFLVRVIPKPSRASYPCMKAAAPFMSSFVIYLLGISGSALLFKRGGQFLKKSRYILAGGAFFGALVVFAFSGNIFTEGLFASPAQAAADPTDFPANQPMGEELGIFPGRVVWEWDPDATNENCTNDYFAEGGPDGYFLAKNNNQEVINRMMDDVVKKLTGSYDVGSAWEKLFTDLNKRKGLGEVSYQPGEKIFIKINQGGAGWLTRSSDLAYGDGWQTNSYPNAETSAPMAISLLNQLVNVYGVAQQDIYIGDPNAHILKDNYDQMYALFPNVLYVDKDHSDLGRTQINKSPAPSLIWSDKGSEITPDETDHMWTEMENADYLVNLATLKAHARAGVTLTAKNHFGSHANPDGAWPLHEGLVCNVDNDVLSPARTEYGMYRVLTDIMGHEKLGGNTVLFIVEGLWGGPEAVSKPVKWEMAPFNGDWPNSILAAQDAVALESVCFDLLKTEFNDPSGPAKNRPWYGGVDDHLHQAADSENWPAGFIYDPEGDGSPMGSMGVHEHWNNENDKQYSRNLGFDYGIELIAPKSLVENTLNVLEAETVPSIDGEMTEACWAEAQWYAIDQTWINWGEKIDSSDFSARFKMSWSEAENLVYYFVEVTDDAFIDGYVWDDDGYYNFDIVEVFIDEDASGGLHALDNDPQWGENSENAFSYHLAVNAPEEGGVESSFLACDLDGGWAKINYADHFPELALRKVGNKYYYEFSMKVYADTYDHSNPEASRVTLKGNKVMGMSLAYCDNDSPDGERDNFFGSVWVPQSEYNDHWKNADGYGKVRLNKTGASLNQAVQVSGSIDDYQVNELNTDLVIHDNLSSVFNDPDGDILSYSASCSEAALSFKIEGQSLIVYATDEFEGSPEVTLVASDGPTQASIKFKITSGTIQVVELLSLIDDFELTQLNVFIEIHENLLEVFSDPRGDGLTYTVECDQPELTFSIVWNVLRVKASAAFEGAADVRILATDGRSEASLTFKLSSAITGISGREQVEGLSCYPNPVNDKLYVDIKLVNAFTGFVDIHLYNMAGVRIQTIPSVYLMGGRGVRTLDMSALANGSYVLRIQANGEYHSLLVYKR